MFWLEYDFNVSTDSGVVHTVYIFFILIVAFFLNLINYIISSAFVLYYVVLEMSRHVL